MTPYIKAFFILIFFVLNFSQSLAVADTSSFASLTLRRNTDKKVQEILFLKTSQKKYEGRRVIDKKEIFSRNLTEVEFIRATLRIRNFLESHHPMSPRSTCRENYTVVFKDGQQTQKRDGCLEDPGRFAALYMELLGLLYKK